MGNSIRINSGAKKIEVNDAGEFIILPLGDDNFIREFYKTLKEMQDSIQKIQDDKIKDDDIIGGMDQIITVNDMLTEKVDKLFGDGACRKIFGDIKPGHTMFVEFFEQIVPFIEDYQREREARLTKYGADRRGSAV